MSEFHNFYEELISLKNLYGAWRAFRSGKAGKKTVLEFEHNLEDNLFALKSELDALTYRHGNYKRFTVHDPKKRIINKARVRDRVVHTLASRKLEEIYQPMFIVHSYACQKERGTHRAMSALARMCRRQSKNYTDNFWYLKCDIKKFFDNVDHGILLDILRRKIKDAKFLRLLEEILASFHCQRPGVGLPLGNFTSQWLGNIYLNELDYFIKQRLKIKFYIRYADDFAILGWKRDDLEKILARISGFLTDNLKLTVHPDKITIKKFSAGIEWVGYKILPCHIVIKKSTGHRILRRVRARQTELAGGKIGANKYYESINSYLGQLKHCFGHKLSKKILNENYAYDYNGKIF